MAEPEPVAEVVAGPEVVAEPEPVAGVVAGPEAVAGPEVVAEPEPVAEVVAEPEGLAEPEVVAEVVAEPVAEPATDATPEVGAESKADVQPEPAQRVGDVVEQPTWHVIAPDSTSDVAPVDVAAAATADPGAEPQWPTRPEWLGGRPAAGLPFLNRPAAPEGGLEGLWAESTRDVVAGPTKGRASTGVRPCASCGLSLSATARFCRRCGASQPR